MTVPSARLDRLVKAGAMLALLTLPGLALGQDNPLAAAAQHPAAEPHAVGQPTAEPQGPQPQAQPQVAQPRAAPTVAT